MSLRTRLTIWYTGVLAITLVLLGTALYFFISVTTQNSIKATLKNQGDSVISQIKVISFRSYQIIPIPELTDYKVAGTIMQITSKDGEVKTNSRLRLPFNAEQEFQKAQSTQSWYTTLQGEDFELLVYHTRLVYNNEIIGVFQAATEISDNLRFLRTLRDVLLLSSLLAVAIAASLGSYLGRKALRPIGDVMAAADRIGSGKDLGQRIEYKGPRDEVGRLTQTINGMLGRLESTYQELDEAYRNQRRFVSDASHELRTPLTTIRGNVELLEKMWREGQANPDLSMEAMHDISEEAARMSRLVSDLLALARADAGYQMVKVPVEMKSVIDEVARKAEFLPRMVEWQPGDLTAAEGAFVLGNADYLQQLLYILIENAFKYTNEGFVHLDALRLHDQLGIRIRDTGIGMDMEEIPQIFERFYRADTSRGVTPGTGLGLAIARWIIDEHRGSIEVVSKKQEGSEFVIWLPIMPTVAQPDTML